MLYDQPLIIQGHRGCRLRYPENSIEGVVAAFAHGAFAVEIDVWLSADHVPMVVHDAVLTSSDFGLPAGCTALTVYAHPAEEVRAIHFGTSSSPRFEHLQQDGYVPEPCQIPDLGSLLDHPGVQPEKINLEIKSDPLFDGVWQPDPATYARTLVQFAEQRNWLPWRVKSFDLRVLDALAEIRPDWPLQALTEAVPADIDAAFVWCCKRRDFAPTGISIDEVAVDQALVYRVADAGLHLSVYTVNAIDRMVALHAMGVRDIITDDPMHLRWAAAAAGLPLAE